ncbi:MAG: hypothetical protein E7349_07935 [Clostridiales bacterium]|nr:hypothetical protein [Clostridiales bacterium]
MMKNNEVSVCGEIIRNGVFVYENDGEKFYDILLKMENEQMDVCTVLLSERLLENTEACKGTRVSVRGSLRSYSNRENRSRLQLKVFAKTLFLDDTDNDNCEVRLTGTICKPIIFTTTNKGEKIARTVLSVEREGNVSDYIPLITYDYGAEKMQDWKVGDKLLAIGTLKSKQRKEKISDMEMYIKTEVADEVFIGIFDRIEGFEEI